MNLCECGCGKNTNTGKRFIRGHNMLGQDLTGKVFGKVTVIRKLSKNTNRQKWWCICACGKEFARRGTVLLSGKSTGCRSCNNGWKKRPYEAIYNQLTFQAKGRTFLNLTYEDFLIFTNINDCHYCGEPITWIRHGAVNKGHHLDRKDNNLGYSKENCVVCCPRCNQAKSNHFTYEEWLEIGKVIRNWKK